MKKIIIAIIALSLVFALASCGADLDTLEAYITAIDATSPAEALIGITVETPLGELNSDITVTYNEDGSSVIEYSYEKFNAIGEGDDVVSVVSGKVTCDKDGKYSGSLTGNVETATQIKLYLDANLLKDISFDDGACGAVVEAANTEAVLGVAIGSDVNLLMTQNDGKIATVTVSYLTEAGKVTITTEYK